ncbi:TonB-dependent receptor domain-containing protein [Paremcibacter congregatus]|uniref:TonB-dependent receptor n=1 Tax=Paremcibacter congregatus TaxID=2043170 RepID=A0A2G4YPW2_9PROT|nr:TonB-dependent receptor [Paremcibacter congregatus]PHZ84335.1 TonB-dependent receptor [Paremcibacter congregatus]QDE28555.1 TonB-dependent receptor [Paremcibacter congregatus]
MKSDFTSRLKYGVSAIAVASTLTFGIQTASAAEEAAAEEVTFEEVVVTGSRIVRKDIQSVSPLAVTDAQEIKYSGHTRLEDMMNSMPQLEASQTGLLANGATGTASLDLRGLGSQRTLVLVNGRRLQPGGINTNAADINQIPAGLVKRVEIATGGAGATYGADAVSGVVNFIMDKEFEGLKVTGGVSTYQHNNRNEFFRGLLDAKNFEYPKGSTWGGTQYNLDMAMGSAFADDKGHATIYVNYRKIKELRQESRDYASCALNGAGTSCGGSANAVVPNFDLYPTDPLTGDTIYGYDRYSKSDFDDGIITDEDLIGELIIGGDGLPSYTNNGSRVAMPWFPTDATSANGFADHDANTFDSLTSTGALAGYDGTNIYNYAPVNHFQRPDERFSAGAFLNYEVSEYFKPYAEVMFARDTTKSQIAESGTFFDEEYNIKCNSPLLSAAQSAQICGARGLGADDSFAVYVGKRNVEGGPRQDNLTHSAFRFVVGAEGDIDDTWRYDVSLTHGSTNSSTAYKNDFYGPNIAKALDVNLDSDGNMQCADASARAGGCLPYQIFTYQGVTAEQANYLTATGIVTGQTAQTVLNGYVTGELPIAIAEDPIQAVFGVEYRKESFERSSDQLFEEGLLLGQGGATASVDGSYDTKEVFGELFIPLMQGAEFAQDLSLELAARYADFSTTGSSFTYKAGLSWRPIDEIKLRASYNRAERAPNVLELFLPQTEGLWGGEDPCSGATPTLTAAQCALTGVSAAQYGNIGPSPADQYNSFGGGNPDLEAEVADTFTVGFVATPIDGLTVSVDYWDIKISGLIDSIDEELSVTQCGLTGNPVFCDLVTRAPNGSLWLGKAGRVVATTQNLGFTRQRGIDVVGDYRVDLGDGTLSVDMVGTYLLKKYTQEIPDFAPSEYECKGKFGSNCFPSPKWRHAMRVGFDSNDFWRVTAKWRYYGGVKNEDATATGVNAEIAAQSYFDLTTNFVVTENIELTAGVNNIFDKEPPIVTGTYSTNANTFAGFYDTLGRYLHMSVTASF